MLLVLVILGKLPYKQRAFIIYDNDVTLKNMFKRSYS